MSYTQYSNIDITASTYDLPNARRSGSVSQCKDFCDATANCAGFAFAKSGQYVNNCWLKRTDANVQPLHDEQNFDLYSKGLNLPQSIMKSYTDASYTDLTNYASDHKVALTSCDSMATEADKTRCKIELVQKHMRDNVDRKVAEIYHSNGTNTMVFDENYRTTMLVGVVWAMLGTTVLYYTFKNL